MYEPLLESDSKYITFSDVQRPELEKLALLAYSSKWLDSEIDMTDDVTSWKTLTIDEQRFIKFILSFSVISDGLVNCNLLERFLKDVTDPSARRFYLFQAFIEDVHMRTYGKILKTLVTDKDELKQLLNPINIPSIDNKVQWIEKWINSAESFGQRLVAFAIVEGIFFSSLFCAFYWFKSRKCCLSGTIQANEFIARDEGLHCDFACAMLKHVNDVPNKNIIIAMIKEAVEIESIFVKACLPSKFNGMNADLMTEYVKFNADQIYALIYTSINTSIAIEQVPRIFNSKNPFAWMSTIGMRQQNNFFEKKTTNYQSAIKADHVVNQFDTMCSF